MRFNVPRDLPPPPPRFLPQQGALVIKSILHNMLTVVTYDSNWWLALRQFLALNTTLSLFLMNSEQTN